MTNLQYIIDANGQRTAVVVPIEDYEEMLEDLHLTEVYRSTKDEPKRDFLDLVNEMRRDGEVDV
jgi:hypothetical protein